MKSELVVNRPRIWLFIQSMNDIITDTDLDIERLRGGIDITRPRKKKDRDNDLLRRECKNKLEGGEFTPLQYLYALTHNIENSIICKQPYSINGSALSATSIIQTLLVGLTLCVIITVPTTCSRPSTKMSAFSFWFLLCRLLVVGPVLISVPLVFVFSFLRSRCPGQSV